MALYEVDSLVYYIARSCIVVRATAVGKGFVRTPVFFKVTLSVIQ